MIKLNNCFRCGGEAEFDLITSEEEKGIWIDCMDCNFSIGDFESAEVASKEWNSFNGDWININDEIPTIEDVYEVMTLYIQPPALALYRMTNVWQITNGLVSPVKCWRKRKRA